METDKIGRLLWISGIPAGYTRKLHVALDAIYRGRIKYIFYPDKEVNNASRAYENGELSRFALLGTNQEQKKKIKSLVAEIANDSSAAILIWGIYPRQLLWHFVGLRHCKCLLYFWSDTNIAGFNYSQLFKKLLYRFVLKRMDGLFVLGSANADFYRNILGPKLYETKRLLHFPYSHDTRCFTGGVDRKLSPVEQVRFIYVGRLEPVKQVHRLIHACRILVGQGCKGFELTIAGGGTCRTKLEELVKEMELGALVSFAGVVKSDKVQHVYEGHDVFILVSDDEPWGVVINEAISSGLAIIAPVWAGAAMDLVIDGFNGYRLLDTNPGTIARAMKIYIDNLQLLVSHKSNTMQIARFTTNPLETCVDAISSILTSV